MVVYTLEQRFAKWACDRLTKDADPPRSSNLTPLDYYLLGGVKDKCYADKPETIDALKNNIREAIGEIPLHTIDIMLKNWTDGVGFCMASQASHLHEIICHD